MPSTSPRVLAVIPARGGSKGVPGKNLRVVGGRALIVHTIEVALSVEDILYDTLLTTDDQAIARVARDAGLKVPLLRPSELAQDTTPMLPVVQHAIEHAETRDGVKMDWILLLQPTAPLRSEQDVRAAVALAFAGGCDSVISVVQVMSHHPALMKRIEDGLMLPFLLEETEGTRRQDLRPSAYMRNGAIYLTARDVVVQHGSLWGDRIRPYVMPEERSVNIDSELDLVVAEELFRRRDSQ
jgi:CMP-N,N'-diacetyllegionaminic acid synthase